VFWLLDRAASRASTGRCHLPVHHPDCRRRGYNIFLLTRGARRTARAGRGLTEPWTRTADHLECGITWQHLRVTAHRSLTEMKQLGFALGWRTATLRCASDPRACIPAVLNSGRLRLPWPSARRTEKPFRPHRPGRTCTERGSRQDLKCRDAPRHGTGTVNGMRSRCIQGA